MNPLKKFTLLALTAMLFFGISGRAAAQSPSALHFDSLKAVKEIDEQNKIYTVMLARSDSAGISNMYTVDATIMNSDTVSVIGRKAILHTYHKWIVYGMAKFTYVTTGVWGSDNNFVVEDGTLTFALSTGKIIARGRYLLVWKREHGKLKIFRDTFFSDTQ